MTAVKTSKDDTWYVCTKTCSKIINDGFPHKFIDEIVETLDDKSSTAGKEAKAEINEAKETVKLMEAEKPLNHIQATVDETRGRVEKTKRKWAIMNDWEFEKVFGVPFRQ